MLDKATRAADQTVARSTRTEDDPLALSPEQGAPVEASSWTNLRRLFGTYVVPYKGSLILAIIAMVVLAAMTAATAWALDPAIRIIFLEKNRELLFLMPLVIIGIYTLKSVADFTQQYILSRTVMRIVTDMQLELMENVLNADLAHLTSRHSGHFLATFGYVGRVAGATTQVATTLLKDVLTVIALLAVMFYQDWKLASLAVCIAPLILLQTRKQTKTTHKATKQSMAEAGVFVSLVSENLNGIRIVRAYGQEEQEFERTRRSLLRQLAYNMKAVRARAAATPLTEALGSIAVAAVVTYAGYEGLHERMELNEFVSFLAAMMFAFQPLRAITKTTLGITEGLTAAARVFRELDEQPRIREAPGARPLTVTSGRVTLEDVSFRYPAQEEGQAALQHVSLEARPGEKVALVGPSGAGKSTILNLIPRFYDATGGRILIDGQNIEHVTLNSLRQNLALVTQEPFLFAASIRDNIAYGRPGASDEMIEAAAKAAAAHDFIQQLPNGYDTLVGEDGARLSGGQRQRVSIARAMVRDAPILLLDEATSSLDSQSEREIQEALAKLMVGRTVIVIAHRFSTIRDADRIYVLDKGTLVEEGTHTDLVEIGGLYGRLYETQFAPIETDPQ